MSLAYELAMKAVEDKQPYDIFIVDAFLPSVSGSLKLVGLRFLETDLV
jgi:hypothetical protein